MSHVPSDGARAVPAPGGRIPRRSLRRIAAFGFVLLGACYRYTPTASAPLAGADVRLHLSEAGSATVAPVIGVGMTSVSGRVVSVSDSELVLAVSETAGADRRLAWAGERITLPRSAVTSFERRSLDRSRTIGVGAASVGAAAAIALLVNAIGSRADGDGDDGTVVIPPEP